MLLQKMIASSDIVNTFYLVTTPRFVAKGKLQVEESYQWTKTNVHSLGLTSRVVVCKRTTLAMSVRSQGNGFINLPFSDG